MDNTIGNQQAIDNKLAWLAGIWDGEGSFVIEKNGKNFLSGRISLTNSSTEMISEVTKIFDSFEISGHLWLEDKKINKHKKCYHLTINKIIDVKKATELMLPFLIAKRAQAEILIRFLSSRMKYKKIPIRNKTNGRIEGIEKIGYSEEEISLYEQLKALNKTGRNIESLRD